MEHVLVSHLFATKAKIIQNFLSAECF